MEVTKKFYKVTSPDTGEVTRSIGWIKSQEVEQIKRVVVQSDLQEVKRETKTHSFGFIPPFSEEITDEEFNLIENDHAALAYLEDRREGRGVKEKDWVTAKVEALSLRGK